MAKNKQKWFRWSIFLLAVVCLPLLLMASDCGFHYHDDDDDFDGDDDISLLTLHFFNYDDDTVFWRIQYKDDDGDEREADYQIDGEDDEVHRLIVERESYFVAEYRESGEEWQTAEALVLPDRDEVNIELYHYE
ncbi:MAG: hypothetical protein ACLFUS_03970 [Candidatus Sumerlaeia bacterium]